MEKIVWEILVLALLSAAAASECGWRMVQFKCKQYERECPLRISNTYRILLDVLWCAVFYFADYYAFVLLGIPGTVLVEIFVFTGIMIGMTDFYTRLIPNQILLILLPAVLVYLVVYEFMRGTIWWEPLLSIAGVILVMQAPNWIFKPKVIVSAGDVKLWLLVAFALSGSRMLMAVMTFSVCFLIYAVIGLATKSIRLCSYFPMGGFISAGLVMGAVFRLDEFVDMILCV